MAAITATLFLFKAGDKILISSNVYGGNYRVLDNTFMTPYIQRPLELGADVVIHSATKYLGGHSDLIAGLVVVNDKDLANKIALIQNATGGVLGPFDSYLLIRGIKTLGVRLDRHVENAEKIAEYLDKNTSVKKVYYPGLKGFRGYEINKKQAKMVVNMLIVI